MTNKLVEICNTKRQEVAARRASVTFATLDARKAEQSSPRGFRAALDAAARTGHALIAEIKKASPSKRSEEHTSELQSLMRISYAVFCLKKKKQKTIKYELYR